MLIRWYSFSFTSARRGAIALNRLFWKLRRSLKRQGLVGSLRKLFAKYVYSKQVQVILAKDLRSGRTRFGRKHPYEIRFLSYPEDVELMRRAEEGRANGFGGWAEQGAAVVAAIRDGELLGVQALISGPYREELINYRFDLTDGEWLLFAGWTAPRTRNSITSPVIAVMTRCIEHALEHGGTRAITCVSVSNTKSLRALMHMSFEETGRELITRRLLGLCWTRSADYRGCRFDQFKRRRRRADNERSQDEDDS